MRQLLRCEESAKSELAARVRVLEEALEVGRGGGR